MTPLRRAPQGCPGPTKGVQIPCVYMRVCMYVYKEAFMLFREPRNYRIGGLCIYIYMCVYICVYIYIYIY